MAAIVYGIPQWIPVAVISWGWYFTVMGVIGSFLIDVAGPKWGSLMLFIILAFIALVYHFIPILPYVGAYSAMMYVVSAKVLGARALHEQPSTP